MQMKSHQITVGQPSHKALALLGKLRTLVALDISSYDAKIQMLKLLDELATEHREDLKFLQGIIEIQQDQASSSKVFTDNLQSKLRFALDTAAIAD